MRYGHLGGIWALAALTLGCSSAPDGEAATSGPACVGKCDDPGDSSGEQYDRFRSFSETIGGIPGHLPPNSELASAYYGMTDSQRIGLATWDLFASDGKFFRTTQLATQGGANMLRVLDSRRRKGRFSRFGGLNDPGCRARTTPDAFGLYLDDCPDDPYASGVIGLRLRPNPAFDRRSWDKAGGAKGHLDPKGDGWKVEPPYLVAMACTICHASPNPHSPPRDIDNPTWKEIVFGFGNQYFREGMAFSDGLADDDFVRQITQAQRPGTSDTSRVAADHIFNPTAINSIANLHFRPTFEERVAPDDDNLDKRPCSDGRGTCAQTYHILIDGADSSGPTGAALRVFINVGSCADQFFSRIDAVWGRKTQGVLSRRELTEKCKEYQQLTGLVGPLVDFLGILKPFKLADAPGGPSHLTADEATLSRGRLAFAERCATCHSSKQPDDPDFKAGDPSTWFSEKRLAFFRSAVGAPDFLEGNFLSSDVRFPANAIGTNLARAFGTNASSGHIWQEYASLDYRQLPAIDAIPELDGASGESHLLPAPAGGLGYYRPPSLIHIWATAPFLHNNALGKFVQDPSVAGRLEAFDDAARKLLYPEERDGMVMRTDRLSWYHLDVLGLLTLPMPVPKGLAVSMIANLDLARDVVNRLREVVSLRDLLTGPVQALYEALQSGLTVYDPVEDRGHTFGADLSDADKQALIAYMKTF